MRRLLLTCAFACLAALGSPAALTPSASGADGPARADARAWLASCRTGLAPLGRMLTVDSVMRSLRAGDRMGMRFELYQRLPRRRFRRIAGPGLSVWNAATPGVGRFRFRKPIQNLPAPAAYFVRVRYRWRDAAGGTFARTSRTTGVCSQPDLRPDLRIVSISAPQRLGPNQFGYRVVLRNAGRTASRDFDIVATLGGVPQPAQTVRGLAAGEQRAVDFTGSRCPPGTRATVVLDPDDRVDEAIERNNRYVVDCP